MASIYNSRKFNLVPPKTKEEEMVLEERDNSFFYSFVLIFCAVVVYSVLTLAQTLIVEPRIAAVDKSIENVNNDISTFDNLKKIHGELYIKSQSLDSILLQDIKLTQLLEISDELKLDIPNSEVIDYSRESNGQFVIDMKVGNFSDINQIFTNSEKVDVLEGFNLRTASRQGDSVVARIGFNITNIISQNAQ